MARFEIHKTKKLQYYFVLIAANGEVIAVSESYTQKHNCIKSIQVVQALAAQAEIKDETKET